MSKLKKLRAQGFDLATVNRRARTWRPRCGQCEVLVVNGVACHEHGCPNRPRTGAS